jgi:sodium-dependent dicarboxylate transporter 2/3/5
MLPVATPPNAIIFGSGILTVKEMIKAGFWLNIISIILLTLLSYLIVPMVFVN